RLALRSHLELHAARVAIDELRGRCRRRRNRSGDRAERDQLPDRCHSSLLLSSTGGGDPLPANFLADALLQIVYHRLEKRKRTGALVNLKVNSSTELDRSFLALSHPARRTIVERLALGPATVGEATRGLAISKPAVSKHLKLLEEAGVIRRSIEGRNHRLSLRARPL